MKARPASSRRALGVRSATVITDRAIMIRSDGAMPGDARVIEFITVKRNTALAGRCYGHWWIELDGVESYGWWPARLPVGVLDMIRGVPGVLNGMGVTEEGTPTRDANHGLSGDYEFHPVLLTPRSDDEVRAAIRRAACSIRGEWRWSTRIALNCHIFQLAVFDAVGLVDGTGNYHTRGGGCPVLRPGRRLAGRVTGRRRWPRNLPPPGQRVTELGLTVPDGSVGGRA